ncbi:uncharacterized protein LOC122972484 isoform X4 [Thunnus albacares]|uniref:uncharacterized protein LOC122972484 isoform X4 n=1 Tax=Thunnus albacares TaxID=8236 RepID=UPI001CF66710|nr:uncharacterized protein LOC122972484 isoform X4 [Thunnus albacares]
MENAQISSYEFDGERHRITARFSLFKAIDPVTTSYLHKLTEEQWKMLATAHTGTDIISLLSDLCQDVVKAITCMIMDNVLPQVYNSMLSLGSSNTSTTMSRIDASEMDLSDYLVSEEAMQCCIRDTLNVSLAEGMGVKEESSHNANKLLELVAGEVTRRVNHSITDFFYAPSFPPLPQSGGSDISCQSLLDDMVYHTAQIMHGYIWREKRFEETSQDSEFSEFSSVDEATDSEELNAEDAESICSEISDVSSPEKVTSPVESIQTAIKPIIKSSLHKITEEQWEFLATDHTDTDTIRLLSGLCLDIVDKITHIVLDNVLPQVYNSMLSLGSSNTSTTMSRIDASEMDLSDYLVSEEAMQCCIRDTLNVSLAEGMGVKEESSHNANKLLELVAGEVTRRVNHSITDFFYAPSFPPLPQSGGSDISCQSLLDDMVYHTAQIMHGYIWREKRFEETSQDSEFSEFSSVDEATDSEELNAEDAESICSEISDVSSPEKVTSPVESIQTAIKPIIKSSLHKITEEQWEFLATDHTDTDTIRLLSGLCLDIVDKITHIVHKEMFSRVRFRMHQTGSSNTSIIMNSIRESESHWFHYMVHEKITKVHIGTCLHWSVGAGMGVEPKRSHNTDKLLVLVSAEVTRRVNLSLAEIFSSTAFPELHKAVESNIYNKSLVDDMVYHMVQILRWCLWRRKRLEEGSPDDDPNLYSGADSIDDIEEFDAEDAESISSSSESSVLPEFSGPDEVTSVEEFDAEDAESICSSSESSVLPEFSGPDEVTSVEEFKAEDAESICSSSEGSACSFDIIKASPRPAVDVSRIENFSGQKSTGRISTFVRKVRRFFRRNTARVNPACEVIQLENGSTQTPPPKKKKRPAVTRMFSSLAKVLRKPFTSCISGGSQDD